MPDAVGPPTPPLTTDELQSAVAQFDQAIYNHEQWYKNLVRVLVTRVPPDGPDLDSDAHLRCRFGQWYYSDAVGALREVRAFVAVGEAHEAMHTRATHLLRRVEDDLPIAVGDLDHFSNALDHLRLELESLRADLAEATENRDPLTDARNRMSLLSDLREQHALVRRGLQDCTLVMVDLDLFKTINDTHGHLVGDTVLRATAHLLQTHMRPYDRLYRYGGEEFLLCLPETPLAGAVELAERLRATLADEPIDQGVVGAPLRITASFGVAGLESTLSVEQSIERADQSLYRAKAAGRNRVVVFGTPDDDG